MKLSRKLREKAETRKHDEQSNECSDERSESQNSEGDSVSNDGNDQAEPEKKTTGWRAPMKQLACSPGRFHKRVRETSSTPNSDSEKRAKLEMVSKSPMPTPPDGAQGKSTGGRAPRKQLATKA